MPAEIVLNRNDAVFARVFRPLVSHRLFVDLYRGTPPGEWFLDEVVTWFADTGMTPPTPNLLCMKPTRGVKGVLLTFASDRDLILFRLRYS